VTAWAGSWVWVPSLNRLAGGQGGDDDEREVEEAEEEDYEGSGVYENSERYRIESEGY